jgi:predicted SnoaL-like aldol condensation-catalyzing enzyme
VVEEFLQDVINEHHGDHAAEYLNPSMQWFGGTVGTVTGRASVAGLFAGVIAAFPDARIAIDDIFGQGDQVVVRVVVSGTQKGAILGIPASGRHVQWDGVDVYRLSHGKISDIWAGDDWTAILNDTGTYKAPLDLLTAQVGRLEKGLVPSHVGPAGIKRNKPAAGRPISMTVCI